MNHRSLLPGLLSSTMTLAVVGLLSPSASAATKTWNGNAAPDAHWSVAANWNAAVSGGDTLIFSGLTNLSAVNDFTPGTSFGGLTFDAGAGAFTLSGNQITLGGNIINNSTATQTVGIDMILSAARTVTTAAGATTILAGVVSGENQLTASGSGTLVLSNANTFSGRLNVSGLVRLDHSRAAQNAILSLQSVSGSVAFGTGIADFYVSGLRSNQALLLENTAGEGINLIIQRSGAGTDGFVGGVSGKGSVTISLDPDGLQTIGSKAWTHTGGTIINSGILRMGAGIQNNALPNGGALRMDGGTLQFARGNTQTQTIGALTGSGGVIEALADTPATLTVQSGTWAGSIRNGEATIKLVKSGPGSLVLEGEHTYTGTTTVEAGKLIINGSLGATAVTVNAGATFGGKGAVGGTLNVSGILSPGDGIGTLTASQNVTLQNNAAFAVDLQSAGYGQLAVKGIFSLGANNNLQLSLDYVPTASTQFTIALVDGTGSDHTTGVFSMLNGVATDLSQGARFFLNEIEFEISYRAEGGTFDMGEGLGNNIMIQVVPEPRFFALLPIAFLAYAWRTRRFGVKVTRAIA